MFFFGFGFFLKLLFYPSFSGSFFPSSVVKLHFYPSLSLHFSTFFPITPQVCYESL